MLRNCEELEKICQNYLGIKVGETTIDGLFTFVKLECLGDCSKAPVVQINDDYYDNLDGDKFKELLDKLKANV
jgi:NADH:ubiquinone oxidoreductase subunit E